MLQTRQRNATRNGRSFPASTVNTVWNKAQSIPGYDPAESRKDSCGAWIHRWSYGKTTKYGWEVDHIKPVSAGGTDELKSSTLAVGKQPWQRRRLAPLVMRRDRGVVQITIRSTSSKLISSPVRS